MILKELVDLARREGLLEDPDFEPKPVRWIVNIGRGGKFLNVSETMGTVAKGKPRPLVAQVPITRARTSGSAAAFLVDKPEYALGFDPDENPRKVNKLATHRRLFREFAESALEPSSNDPGLKALVEFLGDDAAVAQAVEEIRGKAASNDLVAFCHVDGEDAERIHDRPAVRDAWKTIRSSSGGEGGDHPACLVCGRSATSAESLPQIKRVPGGSTSGIALISANASAFESFGLSITESAPICQPCADAFGKGMNRLFHPEYADPSGKTLPRRMFRLSENTAAVYWASGAEEHKFLNDLEQLDFADADKAAPFFAAAAKGRDLPTDDPAPFHALIVTGGQGRATLRGYFQSTVGKVAENARRYLDDIRIVRRYPNSPEYPALSWLVRSLAAQGKFENVDADLAGRLFLAILDGSPFPRQVLAAAVRRIRSEREDSRGGKHSRERLALIRATLNRWVRRDDPRIKNLIQKEVSEVLDVECNAPGYCLGRLFAALEKIQADAIKKPNATITDRFYGAASATPVVVFAPLLRKAQHHVSKFDDNTQTYWSKTIQSILGLLKPADAFPSTLSLEEQGLFALGYYHQRAAFYKGKLADQPATEATAAQ